MEEGGSLLATALFAGGGAGDPSPSFALCHYTSRGSCLSSVFLGFYVHLVLQNKLGCAWLALTASAVPRGLAFLDGLGGAALDGFVGPV